MKLSRLWMQVTESYNNIKFTTAENLTIFFILNTLMKNTAFLNLTVCFPYDNL